MRYHSVPVEAVQITDATFDAPHPNPEHVAGVAYDPFRRRATVRDSDGTHRHAFVGDWIVTVRPGSLLVFTNPEFRAQYAPGGAVWMVDHVNIERPAVDGAIDEGHTIPISVEWTDANWKSRHHGGKLAVFGVYDESVTDSVALAERIAQLLSMDPIVQRLIANARRVA